jgi:hypothetical protein
METIYLDRKFKYKNTVNSTQLQKQSKGHKATKTKSLIKSELRTQVDTFQKKTYKWPTGI